MIFPTKEIIEQKLETARAIFLLNDRHLLEVDASERAITHKFAESLQQVFSSWHVDCEYNRVGYERAVKKLFSLLEDNAKLEYAKKTGRVFPDIIIHRRSKNDDEIKQNNCLVIEAKPSTADKQRIEFDEAKLKAYKKDLKYEYALYLTFHVKRDEAANITWEFI